MSAPADAPAASPAADWTQRIEAVAAVAAEHAAEVDRDGRFPQEAIDAARAQRIFGASVPQELGGLGVSLTELCALTERLGGACSSTAAIIAMHFSQELCLTRHVDLAQDSALTALTRRVAAEGLLLASSTTEKGIGGDSRTSSCAVEPAGEGMVSLAKSAPVISYLRFADAVLVTARRDPQAPSSEQVLVAVTAEQLHYERTRPWDALGLRGTMSEAFEISATVPADQVLPVDFATISARTMLPGSHSLWASAWLGLATQAADIARRHVQKAARSQAGTTPPGALRLAELEVELQRMAGSVRLNVARWDSHPVDAPELGSMSFAIALNTLKVSASRAVRQIVGDAMEIVGIASYANAGPFSLARLLRDAMGPALQVNNDRILHSNASLELVARGRR